MRKYGIEHFSVVELEQTNDPEEREKYWIEKLRTFKNGYNATTGGDGKHYLDYDLIIALYKESSDRSIVRLISSITSLLVLNPKHDTL